MPPSIRSCERDPRVIAFGEDVGKLGDVNQGFKGLQEKYGEWRVTDTGIREATILGQAIGMAMRGLRPICEIQYLDYLLYALQIMSDDLATLHWRTAGGQSAPVIVRTRGHRLEGIWHSGSLMAGLLDLLRGMYLLVPRDMTRAAGFYNTLLKADEPAVLSRCSMAIASRRGCPENIGEMTVPLGVPEVIRDGSGCDRRDLRRLLPHCPGCGREAQPGWRRGRESLTSSPCCRSIIHGRILEVAEEDQSHPLPG